jgi:PTS system nitrogen regulatory IIA component
VILHVESPTVTLCFLEHPIDFRAIDGQPVSVLLTLISPTVRAHLHLLSRLGFVMQNREFKTALKQQASREVLMNSLLCAEAAIPTANNHHGNGQIE